MLKKTIFLTGSTGFLGGFLLRKFLEKDYHVILLIRKNKVSPEARVKNIIDQYHIAPETKKVFSDRLTVLKGDVTQKNLGLSEESIKNIAPNINSVFHCAALTSFDAGKEKEVERQNVIGTENILDFLLKLKNPEFHYVSTAYVAGKIHGAFTETDLGKNQDFNNHYEATKHRAEQLVRDFFRKTSIKTIIYRPSIIVGDSKSGGTNSFFGFYGLLKMVDLLVKKCKDDLEKGGRRTKAAGVSYKDGSLYMPLKLPWAKNKTLNLVPIDYVTNAILAIFQKDDTLSCNTYHIVNPNPPAIKDLKVWICDFFNMIGPEFVDPAAFSKMPVQWLDKFFLNKIEKYMPYLQYDEPKFIDTNTHSILNNTHIKCPTIDKAMLYKLATYCISTDWGRGKI